MPQTDASTRVVLVTGASRGIGHACATHLATRGDVVWGGSRGASPCGAGVEPVAIDVDDDASVAAAVASILARSGRIDAVINNAGFGLAGALEDTSLDEARAQFETNVFGALRLCRSVLPHMRARGRGHIVNIGSIAALDVQPGGAAYVTSKFAVNGFSQALRADFKGKGVRVTQILPGLVRTEFAETRWAGDTARAEEFYGKFPVVLDAADVARAVVYAAEQPPHVTIAELVVVTSA